jgi:hypothetical protein
MNVNFNKGIAIFYAHPEAGYPLFHRHIDTLSLDLIKIK